MKTVTLKHLRGTFELTDEQYNLVSWIATIEKEPNSDKKRWQLWGLNTAAITMGIHSRILFDVSVEKHYSIYRNMNIFSDFVYLTD